MSQPEPPATSRVERIRRAFDATFAQPPRPPQVAASRLLLVQAGTSACAVPLEDCTGVAPAAHVTRLPARHRAFRGLAAVAGSTVPVYDLATQLGVAGDADARWLVLTSGTQRVAFLVTSVEGYAETGSALDLASPHPVVEVAGTPRHIVRLAAIADAIAREVASF